MKSDILRTDNHELFEMIREKLNRRNPPIAMSVIADELGVSVDELCRWVIAYKEPRKHKPYQSPRFPAIEPRINAGTPDWAQGEDKRRYLAWKRQHDGAKATREAANA